jgi:hypothetical protein
MRAYLSHVRPTEPGANGWAFTVIVHTSAWTGKARIYGRPTIRGALEAAHECDALYYLCNSRGVNLLTVRVGGGAAFPTRLFTRYSKLSTWSTPTTHALIRLPPSCTRRRRR